MVELHMGAPLVGRAGSSKPRLLLLGVVAAALSALSALGSSGCSGDCAFDDTDVAGRTSNPEGVPYPTEDWGFRPRDGATAGQTLPNFTFHGYPDSVRSAGILPVSMADFYDPTGSRVRVVLLMVGVMWCPHCIAETEEMAAVAPALRAEGAELVQVMIDGPSRGEGPDRCELEDWVDDKGTTFTVLLDQGARRLGAYTPIEGVPFNAVIDARTMEVLDTAESAIAVEPSVRAALAWVDANPR